MAERIKIVRLEPGPSILPEIADAVRDALSQNRPFLMLSRVSETDDSWDKTYFLPSDKHIYEIIVTLERVKQSFLDWFEEENE